MSSYLGVPPQSGFITTAKQRITSSTNNYVDLDHSISSLADVIVFVNFVKQDYTNLTLTTSSRITLGATLVASDIVEIAYLGKAVATQNPSTNSITNDMLVGSIANDKLAGSIANSKLANSSITLNGSAVSLGGSATVGFTAKNFFSAYDPSNNVPNDTDTAIIMETETYDTASAYNTSDGKFTVPSGEDGKYYLYAKIRHYNETSMNREVIYLYKNGSVLRRFENKGDNVHNSVQVSTVAELSAGDYIQVYYYQNSGSANNIAQFSARSDQEFSGYRIE